jgi:hypothetical protein
MFLPHLSCLYCPAGNSSYICRSLDSVSQKRSSFLDSEGILIGCSRSSTGTVSSNQFCWVVSKPETAWRINASKLDARQVSCQTRLWIIPLALDKCYDSSVSRSLYLRRRGWLAGKQFKPKSQGRTRVPAALGWKFGNG